MARRKRRSEPEDRKCEGATRGRKSTDAKRPFNDVSWYARNDKLLRDAGSLSFNNAVGGRVDFSHEKIGSLSVAYSSFMESIPGICSVYFTPCYGTSSDNSSAINIAARDIYAYVRHANSGSANYDSPDLMLYLMAMDSIYTEWNLCKRAYGLMMQYSQYNRYLPSALVSAAGFDYNDLQSNLADFRYGLNAIAAKINALYVPNVMPLFIRHSWMVSNVWKDSDSDKAQLYVYVPSTSYQLVEQGSTPGLMLDATVYPGQRIGTVATSLHWLNVMVAAVIESEDMNIMAGDLRKAYGPEKAFMLSGIDENYSVEPVYNEEVLNQLHNLRCFGRPSAASAEITINNDTNAIISDPVLTDPYYETLHSAVLNMPWNDVTPANVMVGSRLTAGWDKSGFFCGSEYVNDMLVYQFAESNGVWSYYTSQAIGTGIAIPGSATPTAALESLFAHIRVSQFDWHPLIWVGTLGTSADANVTWTVIEGDLNNYTVVDDRTLRKLHETALLSEFGVPINGTI